MKRGFLAGRRLVTTEPETTLNVDEPNAAVPEAPEVATIASSSATSSSATETSAPAWPLRVAEPVLHRGDQAVLAEAGRIVGVSTAGASMMELLALRDRARPVVGQSSLSATTAGLRQWFEQQVSLFERDGDDISASLTEDMCETDVAYVQAHWATGLREALAGPRAQRGEDDLYDPTRLSEVCTHVISDTVGAAAHGAPEISRIALLTVLDPYNIARHVVPNETERMIEYTAQRVGVVLDEMVKDVSDNIASRWASERAGSTLMGSTLGERSEEATTPPLCTECSAALIYCDELPEKYFCLCLLSLRDPLPDGRLLTHSLQQRISKLGRYPVD